MTTFTFTWRDENRHEPVETKAKDFESAVRKLERILVLDDLHKVDSAWTIEYYDEKHKFTMEKGPGMDSDCASSVINRHTYKDYMCTKCGHVESIKTNHYMGCRSYDHFNCCPKCPPYKKYPEFGGQTTWTCIGKEPLINISTCNGD